MPSSVPTGGLMLRGCWGECRALLGCSRPPLPALLTHHSQALLTLSPHPGEPGGPGRAAAERREGAGPAQPTTALLLREAAGMVTGGTEAGGARHCLQPYGCSRGFLAQPPANPLSSASPSFVPLWCPSCLGPCSSPNSHCKLSWSGCCCGPSILTAWPQLKDGTLRLQNPAQGSVW